MFRRPVIAALLAVGLSVVQSQESYSDCHSHGTVEYCFGPDGEETAISTHSSVSSTTDGPAAVAASTTTSAQTSSVTGCHSHGSDVYCIDGAGEEVLVSLTATPTGELPAEYTGCHSHGDETFCLDPDGNEVEIVSEAAASEEDHEGHSHSDEDHAESAGDAGENCHFHAGVEHCVGSGASESEESAEGSHCGIRQRDYDIGLRVGTLFVVLAGSAISVGLPILFTKLPFKRINDVAMTIVRQFGTGVIIATGYVHLYTHASLMFTNECLGELDYEPTTSAIVMAGIFLAFLTEYIGHRVIAAHSGQKGSRTTVPHPGSVDSESGVKPPSGTSSQDHEQGATVAHFGHHHHDIHYDPYDKLPVYVMEAGVLFHSILIGLTLVVAGDSFYRTLLVVIVFHQFFEGLALGSRIALLPEPIFPNKLIMGLAYAIITPLGMAIGLGVLHTFNGNDRSTIIAIGTLDALSAGILMWIGLVEMWARDWILDGDLKNASPGKVAIGGTSLIAGLVLMSLLGKWA